MPVSSESKPPRVSVVATSFNHGRWVVETLESIAAQTFQDFELIYCDDASSDDSVAIATAWLSSRSIPFATVLNQRNQGVCRTLNDALAHCRGEYVQMIACDDVLLPRKLEVQVATLDAAAPDIAVVHSRATLIDAEGRNAEPYDFHAYNGVPFTSEQSLYDDLIVGNRIAAMTALTRRSVFDSVGPFDESLKFEDWDMWLRIAKSHRFLASEEPTAKYRVHGANLHLTLDELCPSRYWIWRKHTEHPIARDRLTRYVVQMMQFDKGRKDIFEDYLRYYCEQPEAPEEHTRFLLTIIQHMGMRYRNLEAEIAQRQATSVR